MLFLYSLIFFVVVFSSFVLSQKGVSLQKRNVWKNNIPILLALIFIVLFMGLRYNLGRDFLGHWKDYNYLDYHDFGYMQRYNMEYGYMYVVKFAKILPFGAQGIFLLTSLITVYLLFHLYKFFPKLLPLGLVSFFLCGPYEFEINGIRQGIAILAFLNACLYLKGSIPIKKSFLIYVAWILFGTLFHTSCVVLIIFYPIRFLSIEKKIIRISLIVAPVLAYIINITGITNLLFDFSQVETGFRFYDSYLSDEKSDFFKIASDGLNLGQFAIFLFSMIPLFYTKHITQKYDDMQCFIVMYSLGMTISNLYIGNMMITRSAYFFTYSLLLLYPAFSSCIRNTRFGKLAVNQVSLTFFWLWFLVQYFYTLPRFFELHVWPGASVFGITIG